MYYIHIYTCKRNIVKSFVSYHGNLRNIYRITCRPPVLHDKSMYLDKELFRRTLIQQVLDFFALTVVHHREPWRVLSGDKKKAKKKPLSCKNLQENFAFAARRKATGIQAPREETGKRRVSLRSSHQSPSLIIKLLWLKRLVKIQVRTS